jgi:predicted ATPase
VEGLRDLGEHRLKDLSAPERIFQLGDDDFPPLKTLYQTNLPIPATPFLGRERELAEVQALITRDDVRLLTLTGAGGSGKTRLALQSAGASADAYPHGVWWVPLAPVASTAGVAAAAARALGGGGELTQVVADRRLLLLFDNFEHVIDAATDVASLLASCPSVDVLVTSRERLRVQGEQLYPVPVLARAEARELFETRARAAMPEFEPDEHVDALCERLDDLPLAIELAAARVALLTTVQLLERLARTLDLLRGGRDAEVRQRTLRATIEWSYDLLEGDERRLLAALSIFRGGWTLEAAERVCDADVQLLESLVDKSLVRRWESGRFGMLETIREFAAERLDASERDVLLRRLLEHLIDLFEGANLRSETVAPPRIEIAQAERPNVDVALAWAEAAGEINSALRLMWFLEMYWNTNDPVRGGELVDSLLARARGNVDPALRARALRTRGGMFDMTARHDLAQREYELARHAFRDLGDEEEAAHITNRLAMSALQQGEVDRAADLGSEALELDRRRGNRRDESIALHVLAAVAHGRGRTDEAIRLMYECAEIAGEVRFDWWRGLALGTVAEWLTDAGELDEAEQALREALKVVASVGDRVNLPWVLAGAGRIAAERGEAERAGTLWGAIERAQEREPMPAFARGRAQYEEWLRPAAGTEFERGRTRGRTLSLAQAIEYALANID